MKKLILFSLFFPIISFANNAEDFLFSQCLDAELSPKTCKLQLAQMRHESGNNFDPTIYGWMSNDLYCSWGVIQYNVCIHQNWSMATARHVYRVLTEPEKFDSKEIERLQKFKYLLTLKFQSDWMNQQYIKRARRNHMCTKIEIDGVDLTQTQVCQMLLHNWLAGRQYLEKIIKEY